MGGFDLEKLLGNPAFMQGLASTLGNRKGNNQNLLTSLLPMLQMSGGMFANRNQQQQTGY